MRHGLEPAPALAESALHKADVQVSKLPPAIVKSQDSTAGSFLMEQGPRPLLVTYPPATAIRGWITRLRRTLRSQSADEWHASWTGCFCEWHPSQDSWYHRRCPGSVMWARDEREDLHRERACGHGVAKLRVVVVVVVAQVRASPAEVSWPFEEVVIRQVPTHACQGGVREAVCRCQGAAQAHCQSLPWTAHHQR